MWKLTEEEIKKAIEGLRGLELKGKERPIGTLWQKYFDNTCFEEASEPFKLEIFNKAVNE